MDSQAIHNAICNQPNVDLMLNQMNFLNPDYFKKAMNAQSQTLNIKENPLTVSFDMPLDAQVNLANMLFQNNNDIILKEDSSNIATKDISQFDLQKYIPGFENASKLSEGRSPESSIPRKLGPGDGQSAHSAFRNDNKSQMDSKNDLGDYGYHHKDRYVHTRTRSGAPDYLRHHQVFREKILNQNQKYAGSYTNQNLNTKEINNTLEEDANTIMAAIINKKIKKFEIGSADQQNLQNKRLSSQDYSGDQYINNSENRDSLLDKSESLSSAHNLFKKKFLNENYSKKFKHNPKHMANQLGMHMEDSLSYHGSIKMKGINKEDGKKYSMMKNGYGALRLQNSVADKKNGDNRLKHWEYKPCRMDKNFWRDQPTLITNVPYMPQEDQPDLKKLPPQSFHSRTQSDAALLQPRNQIKTEAPICDLAIGRKSTITVDNQSLSKSNSVRPYNTLNSNTANLAHDQMVAQPYTELRRMSTESAELLEEKIANEQQAQIQKHVEAEKEFNQKQFMKKMTISKIQHKVKDPNTRNSLNSNPLKGQQYLGARNVMNIVETPRDKDEGDEELSPRISTEFEERLATPVKKKKKNKIRKGTDESSFLEEGDDISKFQSPTPKKNLMKAQVDLDWNVIENCNGKPMEKNSSGKIKFERNGNIPKLDISKQNFEDEANKTPKEEPNTPDAGTKVQHALQYSDVFHRSLIEVLSGKSKKNSDMQKARNELLKMNPKYMAILNSIIEKYDTEEDISEKPKDRKDDSKPKNQTESFNEGFLVYIRSIIKEMEGKIYLKDNEELDRWFEQKMNSRKICFSGLDNVDHFPQSVNQYSMDQHAEGNKQIREMKNKVNTAKQNGESLNNNDMSRFTTKLPVLEKPTTHLVFGKKKSQPKHLKYQARWYIDPSKWSKTKNYSNTLIQEAKDKSTFLCVFYIKNHQLGMQR